MKTSKTLLVAIFVMVISSIFSACGGLNDVGLYTADQYNAQATQIASAKAITAADKATIKDLAGQIDALKDQAKLLQTQINEMRKARDGANGDLAKYQKLVCSGHSWDEMQNKVTVWPITEVIGSKELLQIEKDTKVSFYLTQWRPLNQPVDESLGSWVLVVDTYSGIALDSGSGCVILDPAKWSIGK